ncbi:MAG: O-antigen ligase family protein [Actinomycetota bacterium]|nr:O-antigen ligase family protein [Actinomycetota bacterium]
MSLIERTLAVQRATLAALLAGSALVFWRGSYDVFNTPKATLVVLATIVVLATGAVRLSRTRVLHLPRTRAWLALALFAAGLVAATLTGGAPMRATVGEPGRHTGLAMYITYVVLFVVSLTLFRDRSPDVLIRALAVAAVPVAGYGLLQAAGIEPFEWIAFEAGPQVVSTMGNANFLAAWLGMVVPLAIGGALRASWSVGWRAAAAGAAALALVVAVATGSLQGVAVAAVGIAPVAWIWAGSRLSRRSRWAVAAVVSVAVVGVVAAVAAGIGPLETVRSSAALSLSTRAGKWAAAWRMFTDHPVAGVGLAGFGDRFNLYRSAEVAARSGLLRSVDDPHAVPLALLTSGGVVLGAGYLAVVGVTAWSLVRGLRTAHGDDQVLLAALGGAWLGYQLQSLVSIDVPPLAALHWVLAGAIVGRATRPAWWTLTLPGAPAPSRRRGGPPGLAPRSPGMLASITLVAVAAGAIALTPLRADVAAAHAVRLAARGDTQAAFAAYERASQVAWWEGMYPALTGAYLTELGSYREARQRHEEAAAREPRNLVHRINIARLSAALGEIQRARDAYQTALALDPKTPEVLAEVGEFELQHGNPRVAADLLQRAVERRPGNRTWQQLLTQAREAA